MLKFNDEDKSGYPESVIPTFREYSSNISDDEVMVTQTETESLKIEGELESQSKTRDILDKDETSFGFTTILRMAEEEGYN